MKNASPILILLAGGKSSRMGKPKGLLSYRNSYWILEQINRFNIDGNETVFVGLGFDYKAYLEAILWFEKAIENPYDFNGKKVRIVINQQPELGPFSTLQSVLKKIERNKEVLILPIDVPMLQKSELEKIILKENKVVVPSFKDRKGHPVKLSVNFWKSLLSLNVSDEKSRLDVQIKQLESLEISVLKTEDLSILRNLNTPKKWQEFLTS